jgi:uncharacterized membrane protein
MIIKDYIKFILIYLVIDYIWLSKEIHKKHVYNIQKKELKLNLLAASLFYLLAPLYFFYYIKPLSVNKTDALKKGMLLGFLVYSTYDLTNKAIFEDYSWTYAFSDIAWGTFVLGIVSYIMY